MSKYGFGANGFLAFLSSSLSAGGTETTINLSTLKTLTGETIDITDFTVFGKGYLTIDPLNTKNIEYTSFTSVDGVNIAVTGATRNLSSDSTGSATRTAPYHPVGTLCIISFGVHNINDLYTYLSTNIAAFETYVNNAVAGAIGTASNTNNGTVELSVSPNTTIGTATITIASPAVITKTSHGLVANDVVQFTTSGSLPTGILPSVSYFVISSGLTSSAFEIAATQGGTAINTSGSQSGTHTLIKVTPKAVSILDPQYVQYYADSGAANVYVITPSPAITAYVAGQKFYVKATNANTTASTLNVNGLGAIAIKKNGSTALVANDILAGQVIQVVYDGTNFQMTSVASSTPILPSISSILTAAESITAGQPVIAGFYQADGGVSFDAKGATTGTLTSSGGTATISMTIAANSNRAIVVYAGTSSTSGPPTATGITVNGVAMTKIDEVTVNAASTLSSWVLMAPASGAVTISISLSSASSGYGYQIGAYSYYNVLQSGIDSHNMNGTIAGTASTTLTPSTQGVLAVAAYYNGISNTPDTGFTNIGNNGASSTANSQAFNTGDCGIIMPKFAQTFSATGGNLFQVGVIGLAPVTAPSFQYVLKASSANPTNTANIKKYVGVLGFATNSASATQSVTVQTQGVVTGLSGLTPTALYYIQDTAGNIGTTAGTNTRKIGIALDTTTLLITNEP